MSPTANPSRALITGIALLLLAAATGCARPPARGYLMIPWPPPAGDARTEVWLVQHRFHTRVAMRYEDVDPRLWPASREFAGLAYLEAGWGDRGYYPNPDPSVWDAINAVIRPTPAALHVGGFHAPPADTWPDSRVVRIPVSRRGAAQLGRFVQDHYALDVTGAPIRIAPGYYARSWFYEATGRYHAFSNSNTWSAAALRVAGVPVEPAGAITAGAVVDQALRFGEEVSARRR